MDPSTTMSLGQRLRKERKRLLWSQERLAEAIGASAMSIHRWEHDKAIPQPHYIEQLCRVFNLPADVLFRSPANEVGVKAVFRPIWSVPFRRNPFFTGREGILRRLHEMLHVGRTVSLTQVQAISGLGGVGKTQTAIEYAYRYHAEYQAILWVHADSREILLGDFMALAGLLDLPVKNERDPSHSMAAVKCWLQEHSDWLLILDNVEDFHVVSDVLAAPYPGDILLTTRTQSTGTLAEGITLDQMEPEEGALFLLRRAKLIASNMALHEVSEALRAGAQVIAQLLDGLPLALDQAGAYIEETAGDISGYLDRYRTQHAALLNLRGTCVTGHPESVTTTLSLSIKKVERTNPAAADLLRLCAFFHPDAIPEELITAAASELGPVLQLVAADPLALDAAIKALRRFSLLRRHPETKTLTIHRLVQTVLRDRMDDETEREWTRRAVRAVNQACPDMKDLTFVSWQRCRAYLPHVNACVALIARWEMAFPAAMHLLKKAGHWLLEQQQYEQAAVCFRQALIICEQTPDPEHPRVAESYNDLALLYHIQGKYTEAEPLYVQALSIRTRSLGPLHLDVAESYNNLASLYRSQGKYTEAEPLYVQALSICEQLPEPVQNYVAICLTNLGDLNRLLGKYTQAEQMLLQGLANWREALVPGHPNIAIGLNALAKFYCEQKRYQEAELLCQQALDLRERALGCEHPRTLQSQALLARLLHLQGHYMQAESFYQRLLMRREQVHGSQHLEVAETLLHLADLSAAQGKDEVAESFYRRGLLIWEQVHTSEPVGMIACLERYAQLLRKMHRKREAWICEARARQLRERGASAPPISTDTDGEMSSHLQQEQAVLHDFFAACCAFSPQAWSWAGDLWQAYQHWAQEQGRNLPLSRQAFTQHLRAQGCHPARTHSGRYWYGVTVNKEHTTSMTPCDMGQASP